MIELRPGDGRFLRIGHRGAPALAPENTLRSLEAAIRHGVDVVEIDVFDLVDGTLVLAHSDDLVEVSHGAARGRVRQQTVVALRRVAPELPTLEEALEFLAGHDVWIQIDVKAVGHEAPIVDALRRHRVFDRTFVSTTSLRSLRVFAEDAPWLPRSLTYPEDRYGFSRRRLFTTLVAPALLTLRRTLPFRLARWLRAGHAQAATLHWGVVSQAAIEVCHRLGMPVYAWTVNEPRLARALLGAGTDGIITDDPRIFGELLSAS